MKPEDKLALQARTLQSIGQKKWIPNTGPQTEAYYSKADVLLYGGEPGGGKSQLLLGLAFNEHQRTLMMRRKYTDLGRLIEDALKINGGRDGFNGSPPPKIKLGDDRVIGFGAANRVGDEQDFMGQGRDLLAVDEATHFAEMQIKFLMGWNRTETPGQRVRTVLATNPPLTAEGLWVNKMFAPWLDPTFPDPAKPGELRWAISDAEGEQKWVNSSEPVYVNDKLVYPKSYTYIPASVKDNPYYAATSYERELDNMPEPYRSILLGGFKTSFRDQQNQIIPTAWIIEAQKRWRQSPPANVPMCAMGVDASGGGVDPMVIAIRHDGWFAPLIEVKANEIPMERSGAYCAGVVVSYRSDNALVTVDLGGGYGGPLYESLRANEIETYGYKGAEKSTRRSRDGKLHFTNKRTAALWAIREALDPGQPGGSPIAFPADSELMADLTAPTFEVTPNGIKAESKEAVCERLGRSTNKGDAVIMCWYQGPREETAALEWIEARERKYAHMNPKVVSGGRKPLTARGIR
jgi:hypothetical protein